MTRHLVVLKAVLLSLPIFLSACGQSFRSTNDLSSLVGATSVCFYQTTADACVFYKNPVAGSHLEALANPISLATNLALYQSHGVKITGLDGSGFLQNSSISVDIVGGERATAQSGSWKFSFQNDANAKAVQVHTYYWLNHVIEELGSSAGSLYLKDKAIKVLVNAQYSGWDASTNTISLEASPDGNQLALDAGLSIHLLGQANLHFATNGLNEDFTGDSAHLDCGFTNEPVYEKSCCTTANGCARAIASGQADYLIARIFPDQPTLGESWVNRASGFRTCDISRDLRLHADSSAQSLYAACEARGAPGQIYNMGTIYASVWYEIRKKVETENPELLDEFDRLYMLHLAEVRGNDTFTTILSKIRLIDQSSFSGSFRAYFDAEYTRRGLTLP